MNKKERERRSLLQIFNLGENHKDVQVLTRRFIIFYLPKLHQEQANKFMVLIGNYALITWPGRLTNYEKTQWFQSDDYEKAIDNSSTAPTVYNYQPSLVFEITNYLQVSIIHSLTTSINRHPFPALLYCSVGKWCLFTEVVDQWMVETCK